jgi:inositol phosphorylceramide synthase catalytic subunit
VSEVICDLKQNMSAMTSPIFAKAKYSFPWPVSIPNPIPRRYRARRLRSKLRARQSPASSITSVETSFSPSLTLRKLSLHKWTVYDAQYLLLLILGIFALLISPAPGPLAKMGMVILLIAVLIIPVTSQFFFPFLPILTWLVFFFSCR